MKDKNDKYVVIWHTGPSEGRYTKKYGHRDKWRKHLWKLGEEWRCPYRSSVVEYCYSLPVPSSLYRTSDSYVRTSEGCSWKKNPVPWKMECQLKCAGVTAPMHTEMQVCTHPYNSRSTWISTFLVTRYCRSGHHDHWTSTLWPSMHGRKRERTCLLHYTSCCEMGNTVHWSWRQTFWTFVTAANVQAFSSIQCLPL
jgi:hypothetical protein